MGIGDVVITAVHSEKTHLKKLMMMRMRIMMMIIIIIINKLEETMAVSGHQKLTFAMKLRPEM